MRLTFVQLRVFEGDFRDLSLEDEDLRALEAAIMERPDVGRVIAGTGGLRKMRFAPPSWNRGKSDATRVCYVWFVEAEAVYLVTIYTKQEMDNISPADKSYYRGVLTQYRRYLQTNRGVLP